MKKIVFLCAAVFLLAGNATAQDWLESIKKAATTVVDDATGGKLTQYAIQGTWNYKAPAVKFEGESVLSDVAASALESSVTTRLEKAYLYAGIKAGACSFTFAADGTFTSKFGTHTPSGTYEFDASTHLITLHFTTSGKMNLGTIEGHAYISGTELQLVFPVTKLTNMVAKLGSRISSLATVTALLEKYKDIYIGFGFAK